MLNGAWQWPQLSSDVESHLMGETERVMFLMLWGIKCKWINGTYFLHTSEILFRSANIMKALSSLPLKKHVLFRKWDETPLIFSFSDPTFFLEYVGVFCFCLVEGLKEGNEGSLQTTWLNMTGVNQSSCAKPVLVKKKHCCSFWENKHLCALQLSLYFGGGKKRVPRNAVGFLSAYDL